MQPLHKYGVYLVRSGDNPFTMLWDPVDTFEEAAAQASKLAYERQEKADSRVYIAEVAIRPIALAHPPTPVNTPV